MVSIIICSIDENRLTKVCANIADTIGVPYEILAVDNRGTGKGICQIYNEQAEKAKYDYLCFVHEDVELLTKDWGRILSEKASEAQTGIIGFSGAAVKTKALSGQMHRSYCESNVIDGVEGQPIDFKRRYDYSISGLKPFAPVVTVDGLLQFMRKDVWQTVRYDQTTFTGFHLYDLDIATAAFVRGYCNYVCHDVVKLIHYSQGNYSQNWYDNTLLYQEKWADILPLYVNRPDEKQIAKDEEYIFFNITYHLMKRSNIDPCVIWERVKYQIRCYPLYHKAYYQLYRYIRYKKEHQKKLNRG